MKVLIASGGSGGHIFPAVALARELRKENADIIFVASRRQLDKRMLSGENYKKAFLSANPMPYRFGFRIFAFLLKLVSDSAQALYILLRYRPRVVVGFGGYTGGAILLLAALMKISTVIHEQNLVPGRTNRLLDGFVGLVSISFEETRKYFKNKNVVFTGNPLREESLVECREDAIKKFNLAKDKFSVLIMGGSQGASSLNELASRSLGLLPSRTKERLQVVHIAGLKGFVKFKNFYAENGITARVFGFVDSINEAYSVSDLAVSRSGAAAIFELAAFGKPMILIPYPNAKNNQRLNAVFFAQKGAAVYKEESELDAAGLGGIIEGLIDDPEKRKALSENAKSLSITNGAKGLKDEILKWKTHDRK